MMQVKSNAARNGSVDIFRGIAMLLVIVGHTLSASTAEYENTFLYKVIWTLQMPMFMLISGYVTKFSKRPDTFRALLLYVKKRTVAYLLPWLVWTVCIRGLLLGAGHFLDPSYLFWHMDSGYWFLASLWTICVLFGVGQYGAAKVNRARRPVPEAVLAAFFTCCASAVLLLVAKFAGLGFFGIKLTLYYVPFFLLGFLYGGSEELCRERKWFRAAVEAASFAAALLWLALLIRFDIVGLDESVSGILIRMTASVAGCAAVFGFGSALLNALRGREGKTVRIAVQWVGVHSLEIYLIHYLFLAPVRAASMPDIHTMGGLTYLAVNTVITVGASAAAAALLSHSGVAKKVLFAKK